MWEKASCGSQSVEKLILSNDKCIIINFACFFAHVLFFPFFSYVNASFSKSAYFESRLFYKSKKKKNCGHLIPTQESYFKNFFLRKKVQEKKKNDKKSEGSGVERKRKGKVKTAVSLLNPKTISKFCFVRMPKIRKLMSCTKGSRPSSRPPFDGFCGKIFAFYMFLNQKMARRASKPDFRRNSQGRMG